MQNRPNKIDCQSTFSTEQWTTFEKRVHSAKLQSKIRESVALQRIAYNCSLTGMPHCEDMWPLTPVTCKIDSQSAAPLLRTYTTCVIVPAHVTQLQYKRFQHFWKNPGDVSGATMATHDNQVTWSRFTDNASVERSCGILAIAGKCCLV